MKVTSFITSLFSLSMVASAIDIATTSLSRTEIDSFPRSVDDFGPALSAISYQRQALAVNPGDLVPISFRYNRNEGYSPREFYVGLYGTEDKRFVRSLGKIGAANIVGFNSDSSDLRFYANFQDGGDAMRIYNVALFCTDDQNKMSYAGKGLVSYINK